MKAKINAERAAAGDNQQAEDAREQVREKAAAAFAELKKFEITAERRAALAQQEENRSLKGELDEIAQQQDRQKQARGA